MQFEEHCRHCKEKLGEEFCNVHLWLDEFFGKENLNLEEDSRKESQDTVSVWWTYVYRKDGKVEFSKQRRTY